MRKILHIVILLGATAILALMLSCQNSDENYHHDIVSELLGSELNIPSEYIYQIKETPISYDIDDSDFKVICYLDSTGCTSCKMKLSEWDKVINEFKTIDDVSVNFVMIISPLNVQKAYRLLNIDNFRHPIVIDSINLFSKINHVPKDTDCHTFLLDSDNKIICIGNPVTNPKIRKLYKKYITRNLTATDTEGQDTLPVEFSKKSISLGAIYICDTTSASIDLYNHGATTLHIEDIVPSCDCVTITNQEYEIKPNEAVKLNIHISPHSDIGIFQQELNIFFEEEKKPETIKLHGYVINH